MVESCVDALISLVLCIHSIVTSLNIDHSTNGIGMSTVYSRHRRRGVMQMIFVRASVRPKSLCPQLLLEALSDFLKTLQVFFLKYEDVHVGRDFVAALSDFEIWNVVESVSEGFLTYSVCLADFLLFLDTYNILILEVLSGFLETCLFLALI